MKSRMCSWLLALALAGAPLPVAAQCTGGMMSRGHEHGQQQPKQSRKEAKKPDRKAARSAAKLLSDTDGRDALLAAVLDDPDFLRELVSRMAGSAEWRALMRERVAAASAPGQEPPADLNPAGRSGEPPNDPPPAAPLQESSKVYRCPMHPDVVSDRPGKCPQCGMTLETVP